MDERPENPWINNTVGPPIWSTARIRRRPGTVSIERIADAAPENVVTQDSGGATTLRDTMVFQNLASTAHELAGPMTIT